MSADGRAAGSFVVDHLASFDATVPDGTSERPSKVGASQAMMSPEEAVRRLRQLTKRRSVYTTRVTLSVTNNEMTVLDAQTNSVMERFPLGLVHRPTAMTSDIAGDKYDNVVVLIVLGDPQQQLPPEVHIFQCLKHRASSASTSTTINTTTITTSTITVSRHVTSSNSNLNVAKLQPFLADKKLLRFFSQILVVLSFVV